MHGPKRGADADSLQNSDVIVTSYPLLLRDWNVYQQQLFSLLVLDEAQSLKNPSTKLYRVLQSLRFEQIIALSGTPIENHLGELWAQFNLLQPGLLGSQSQFNRLFRAPIERQRNEARRALLVERVRPFILRRQKQQIATELPGKTEILQSIPLEEKQAQLYESVRVSIDASLNKIIAAKGFKHSQIEILDAMLKLRQICCHPQLLNQVGAKRLSQSAKLDWLVSQLPGLLEDGRNILIFSQFSSMLGLIATTLDDMGIAYSKLTGETLDREAQIARFKQGKNRVFLISLKAGGTGLNLTEADTVIHFDPWWNPAAQAQATDRAYRIGQDKPVFVYRLIAQGSIEEKIVELQQSKQALAAGILDGSMDATETRLNEQMLQSLLAPLE
ncbi:DEAD/DEAH box helicase [Pseudobowmanella zhangzhouensis]|uniref:DEAD/DEAH box helicase n=1 Tax=Pseudobowmanella zhangzhouensis TaxID=1537679 RepID=UPI00366D4119